MRPILLQGHTRPLTQIKYNREGDLLFTAGKDKSCNVWFSDNGERLGTYDGHNGVIWSLDISRDTKTLLTGSGDYSAILWDIETGSKLTQMECGQPIKSVGFSYSSRQFFLTKDNVGNKDAEILLYDARDQDQVKNNKPWQVITLPRSTAKMTVTIWGPLSEVLISGHDNGDMAQFNPQSGDRITLKAGVHDGRIEDLQMGRDGLLLISASKDKTSCLLDPFALEVVKTYKSDRPVNSAAVSPIRDHVVLGGGQEAKDVTVTAGKAGKFEAKFYHMIYEEEFGRVKGHFGPINTIAISPDGLSYSSGGEEGYVRVHNFDSNYLEFDFDS